MKKEENINNTNRSDDGISSAQTTRHLMSRRSYLSYAVAFVRASSPYRIWNRLLTYFRRFRLLSIILSVTIRIVTIIETSAFLIATAAVAVIMLPILLTVALVTSVAALVEGRKQLDRLSKKMSKKTVYVFIPTETPRDGGVLSATLSQLASNEDNMVFCVIPPRINIRGELFLTVRREHDRSYSIKRHFFFRLRKLLKTHSEQVYLIY